MRGKKKCEDKKSVKFGLLYGTEDWLKRTVKQNGIRWYDYALLATVILVPTLLFVFGAAITIYHLVLEIASEDCRFEWLLVYPFGLFTMSVIWLYTVGKLLWALISRAKEGAGAAFDAN
ncbi:MAG: hypothetical protein Q4F84_08380, partial [Fibrobacter sp.]|nr:hypothetical protein [Fibrobacter sp.]